MRVFAGCDGGGTKCTVKVALYDNAKRKEGESQSTAGPANVQSDPELALANIQKATWSALQGLQLDGSEIEHFVFALAGAGSREVQQHWERLLADRLLT